MSADTRAVSVVVSHQLPLSGLYHKFVHCNCEVYQSLRHVTGAPATQSWPLNNSGQPNQTVNNREEWNEASQNAMAWNKNTCTHR